jgi:hypothetical protein
MFNILFWETQATNYNTTNLKGDSEPVFNIILRSPRS